MGIHIPHTDQVTGNMLGILNSMVLLCILYGKLGGGRFLLSPVWYSSTGVATVNMKGQGCVMLVNFK